MELLAKLGVHWSLIVAQIVNFAIVLGILSFFVYKPFLRLLDERSERIRRSMEEAKAIEEERRHWDEVREKRLKEIDVEVGALLEKAHRDAEATRMEILSKAQKEVELMLEKGRRTLSEERERVFSEVQSVLSSMIVRVAERVLEREFTAADQKRILSTLEKDLPSLLT